MKRSNVTKQGFTLIELLVVVLIIGILAAVALPQYQFAVAKSRFAKLYSISRIYQRAAQEYIANTGGDWPGSFEDLSVDAPGAMTLKTPTAAQCVENDEFYCCLKTARYNYQKSGIMCGLADYSLAYGYEYKSANSSGVLSPVNTHVCVAKQENSIANKVCAAYNTTRSSANLPTPLGHKTGYYYYQMK